MVWLLDGENNLKRPLFVLTEFTNVRREVSWSDVRFGRRYTMLRCPLPLQQNVKLLQLSLQLSLRIFQD